jgi:hypothetical protein
MLIRRIIEIIPKMTKKIKNHRLIKVSVSTSIQELIKSTL